MSVTTPSAVRRSSRTRARILDAAASALAAHGYTGLRIQDVAARADVRPAAIYYYFDSREALVEEVLWSGMARLGAHVAETVARCPVGTSGLERMLVATEAHVRQELDTSDYAQASIRNAGHVPAVLRQRNASEVTAYRNFWRRLLAEAIADGSVPDGPDRDLELRFAIGALNWIAEWFSAERHDINALVVTARVFVEHGLKGPATSPIGATPRAAGPPLPADTRGRILAAAAKVLRSRGYATTRLAEIAELAGVQAPAIYHYFGSRQELLQAAMTEGNEVVLLHVQSLLASLPALATTAERLAVAVAGHLEAELELSDFAAALIRNAGQAPEPVRVAIARGSGAYHDVWRVLLSEAAGRGLLHDGIDTATARLLVHGALNWAAEWWHPEIPVDDMIAAAQGLVVHGLIRP